jgi:arginyl-tRNA synthetase
MDFKKELNKFLIKELKLKNIFLEIPNNSKLGDFAFPCFILSKQKKKSPIEIAKELEVSFKKPKYISHIISNGPYLNFFIDKNYLSKITLEKILKEKNEYGKGKKSNNTVLIESPGPNTNKPLHLGHIRNMLLGNTLANLNKKIGNNTIKVDIVNDRGIHICKSMLAYQKFGKNKKPNKKLDHFVGDFYVLYDKEYKKNPELEKELNEMLIKWESEDKITRKLWKKMNKWVLEGFKETYQRFDTKIDKTYYESDYYNKGKDIIQKGLKQKIFKKDEIGNIIIDLTKEKLDKKVVLRADGTSIYITQDIALADLRYKDFKMDKMIYVVGNEQLYHFKVLFEILKKLNYKFTNNLYHLAYGYISLPAGRMKSREGTVVDADNLADNMKELAKKNILIRNKNMSKKELDTLSEIISMGALKFFMLKYDFMKDFTYNPKESIKFEGETGPYIQYSLVRIKSILKKSKIKLDKVNYSLLTNSSEERIIALLANYPDIIKKSTKEYKSSILCKYLIDLSKEFNAFYHKCQVIGIDNDELTKSRLTLIKCIYYILEDGLNLLGIKIPSKM